MLEEKIVFSADSPSSSVRIGYCRWGLVGGHGLGQDFAQCSGFPHWKQAWGGAACCVLWVGPLGRYGTSGFTE
jgi:hypothetical protein